MKKYLIILIFIGSAVGYGFKSSSNKELTKTVTVIVNFSFAGKADGFGDHLTKTDVYIDGNFSGSSGQKYESDKISVKVSTTKGKHDIKIINYAFLDGAWTEHTIKNNYSQDFIYETNQKLSKKITEINLVFDRDIGLKILD